MTLADLMAEFWFLADEPDPANAAVPAEPLSRFFAEAELEAAIRGRLIHEVANAEICQIAVTAGTASYALHPSLFEISHLRFAGSDGGASRLDLVSSDYLDLRPQYCVSHSGYDSPTVGYDWRSETASVPTRAIHTEGAIRLVPVPTQSGTLYIEGYRTPIGEVGDDPEILPAHHRHLIQWAIYRAFSITGTDQFDMPRALAALAEFERYFGLRPDCDLRRSTRVDTPHRVAAFMV